MGALVITALATTGVLDWSGPTQLPANQSGELAVCINDDVTGAYGAGLTDNQGQVEILAYPSNTRT